MPTPSSQFDQIRVAVVTDTPSAARHIGEALHESGYSARAYGISTPHAVDRVRELDPHVVLLRLSQPGQALAAAFGRMAAPGGPALVLLTPSASVGALGAARDTGATVHLVEPVTVQALAAAVWLAAARARDLQELRRQLTHLREAFASRRLVEQAKEVLMRRLDLTEDEAHRRLQQESRSRNRKLADTAWRVLRADAALARKADASVTSADA